MARMADEEVDYWDEYYSKNPPKVSGDGKSGFFLRKVPCGFSRRLLALAVRHTRPHRLRSRRSASTRAVMASTTGTARGQTHTSWRP